MFSAPHPGRNTHRLLSLSAYSVCLLLVLWASHHAAFGAPFYFDTVAYLEARTNLHLTQISAASLSAASRFDFDGPVYRPLPQLSLALTYYWFDLQPQAYRIGNLLIHWAAALSLLFLSFNALRSPRVLRGQPAASAAVLPAAMAVAALWALHPVQTNVVSYVIQRMASLTGLFTFLAVGAYLQARLSATGWSWRWFGLCLGCFALGLASKENAVTIPLLIAAAEGFLLDRPGPRVRRILLVLAGVATLAVVLVVLAKHQRLLAYLDYRDRSFTLLERLLTQARLQLEYVSLLLFPYPGRFILTPDVPLSTGLLKPPSTLVAIGGIVACGVLAIRRAKTAPLVAFTVATYFISQLLEATIIPLEQYFEHRMYIPSAMLFLGLVAVFVRATANCRALRGPAVAVLLGLLACLSWATYVRTQDWADPIRFWKHTVEKAPNLARAHTNLGRELLLAGREEEAEAAFRTALGLPNAKVWLIDLQLAKLSYQRGERELARELLLDSLDQLQRTNWEAPQRLAMLAVQDNDLGEARRFLELSLAARQTVPETWRLLAVVEMKEGQLEVAEKSIRRVLDLAPNQAEAWNTLGAILFQQGAAEAALAAFEQAVRLAPQTKRFTANRNAAVRALPPRKNTRP